MGTATADMDMDMVATVMVIVTVMVTVVMDTAMVTEGMVGMVMVMVGTTNQEISLDSSKV